MKKGSYNLVFQYWLVEIFKWGFLEAIILNVRGRGSNEEGYSIDRGWFPKDRKLKMPGGRLCPSGDGHPTITSCYRCETERVVEAVDSFKNTSLSSENPVMNNTCHKDKALSHRK